MAWYEVTLRGDSREVYAIEAGSEEEARENWHTGQLVHSENSGMDLHAIEKVDD